MVIKSTSIHISWKPTPLWTHSDILYIEIFWTNIPSGDNLFSQTCVNKNTSDISVTNLTPETVYVFWIGVILKDSKVVYSDQIHFITAKANGKYKLLTIVANQGFYTDTPTIRSLF